MTVVMATFYFTFISDLGLKELYCSGAGLFGLSCGVVLCVVFSIIVYKKNKIVITEKDITGRTLFSGIIIVQWSEISKISIFDLLIIKMVYIKVGRNRILIPYYSFHKKELENEIRRKTVVVFRQN
jgi:hypothetical protein